MQLVAVKLCFHDRNCGYISIWRSEEDNQCFTLQILFSLHINRI